MMTKDLVKRDGHRSALPLVRLFKAGAVVEIFLARHLYIHRANNQNKNWAWIDREYQDNEAPNYLKLFLPQLQKN